MTPVKIVFLYSLLTPSVAAVLRALVRDHAAEIIFYYWDKGGNKPFDLPAISGVEYRATSTLNAREIRDEVQAEDPDLIYVVAWQERKYLRACRSAIARHVPVICGFDDNWLGTLRQRLGALVIRLIRRFHFSHAMASGPRQYHYACKFGFVDSQILYYLFSADTERFGAAAEGVRGENAPFIFAGRYSEVKGIATLAAGYRIYRQRLQGRRPLICFGNGDQKALLDPIEGIDARGYTDHATLLDQCRTAAAFVLPSVYDPSPLVVHEMALSGMPMLLSENVGNRLMFLINGFNGFTFRTGDPESLAAQLKRFDGMSPEELAAFGARSRRLSTQHAPDLVAASLVSVLAHHNG